MQMLLVCILPPSWSSHIPVAKVTVMPFKTLHRWRNAYTSTGYYLSIADRWMDRHLVHTLFRSLCLRTRSGLSNFFLNSHTEYRLWLAWITETFSFPWYRKTFGCTMSDSAGFTGRCSDCIWRISRAMLPCLSGILSQNWDRLYNIYPVLEGHPCHGPIQQPTHPCWFHNLCCQAVS